MITEGSKKGDNKKFKFGIGDLVVFMASGAFAKVHKEFLEPSSRKYWGHEAVNCLHNIFHDVIGLLIQIVLILLLVKLGITVWREIRSPKE